MVLLLEDINAHHPSWGHRVEDPTGIEVAEWPTGRNLKQNMGPSVTTWRRGAKESVLNLLCTTNLTHWTPDPLHLARIGSVHDMIAAVNPTLVREARTYYTID